MARNTAKSAQKTATRRSTGRVGRPSNAVMAQRLAADQSRLIEVVAAAASAAASGAVQAFLGEGTVSTIGAAQAAQSQSAGSATSSAAQTAPASTTRRRQSPGRRRDPNSKRSQAFAMYADQQGKMPRADIVNKMVADLGIQKNVANTYYHEAEREATGGKRRGAARARA